MTKKKIIKLIPNERGEYDLSILIRHGIFVPNWFTKEHFEQFTGKQLANRKYKRIVEKMIENGIYDDVSTLIKERI
jgi:hypothetical protein